MTTKSYFENFTMVGASLGASLVGLLFFLVASGVVEAQHLRGQGLWILIATVVGVVVGTFTGDLVLRRWILNKMFLNLRRSSHF